MKRGAEAAEDLRSWLEAERLPEAYWTTVDEVLRPLADWIIRRRRALGRCPVVGLCGPQGSGKSTAVVVLRRLLEAEGLRVAAFSIDDIYLARAARAELAARVHPLLATRGPPGTHDIALGLALLRALAAGDDVVLPRFDKASDDQLPQEEWKRFEGPAHLVLFEGWCVGASPEAEADLLAPVNRLEQEEDPEVVWRRFVNAALADYQRLFGRLDLLVQLAPPSFDVVAGWRQQQEAKLRARTLNCCAGPGVMTNEAVSRFVAHFERVTRRILAEMPARADALVQLGPKRQPLSLTLRLEA